MQSLDHLTGLDRLLGPFLQLLLLLLLLAHQCFADDPPFKIEGPAESLQFKKPPGFEFRGDHMPVSLLPKSGQFLYASLFEPRGSMDMHFLQLEDMKLPTLLQTTIEHQDHDYVNLESIEPFLFEPVTCRMARSGEKTDLDLHFKTREAFYMAQDKWTPRFANASARTILFVVEGPYCFEAAGTRSVYRSTDIRFDLDRTLVVIEAEPLHAQVYWESGWAHSITVQSLKHQPHGHVIVPRASLDITHDPHTLRKRGWHVNIHHNGLDLEWRKRIDKDLGYRHDFIGDKAKWYNGPHLSLTCLQCHAKGEFTAGFSMKIDLSPHHGREGCDKKKKESPRKRSATATAFLDEHENLQPIIYAFIEAERIQKHQRTRNRIRKLRKREGALPIPLNVTCTPEDITFPICHEQHMPRALLDADPCNQFLHPTVAAEEIFKCAMKSISSVGFKGKKCRKKIKEDLKEFDGIKDYTEQFIKAHLAEMDIYFEVVEDIDVRFQLELAGTLSMTFWLDVDFLQQELKVNNGNCVPIPDAPVFCYLPAPPIKPSFGWFFSMDGGSQTGPVPLSGLPSGETDEKGKQKSIGSKLSSAKSTGLEAKKDGPGSVDNNPIGDAMHGIPVPTLDVTPVGVSLSLALEANLNITTPGFRVKMPKGKLIWRPLKPNKADQLVNDIEMDVEYLPAKLEIKNPKVTFRMSAGPRWKFHLLPFPKTAGISDMAATAGISDPLALGGHFQPIRMDHIFSVAPEGDADCSNGTLKYEVLLRTGMDAYVMVLFQRTVDLNWIAPLQKSSIPSESIRGLWFSKRVYVHCLDVQIDQEHANKKLNEKLLEIQQPIVDAFAKLGEKISAKADDDFEETPGLQKNNWRDQSEMEFMDFLEYASWQNRVGPGMTWEECKVGVHPGCDDDHRFLVAVDPPRESRMGGKPDRLGGGPKQGVSGSGNTAAAGDNESMASAADMMTVVSDDDAQDMDQDSAGMKEMYANMGVDGNDDDDQDDDGAKYDVWVDIGEPPEE